MICAYISYFHYEKNQVLLVINVLIVFIMISFGATSLISLIGPLAGFFPGLRDWDMMTVPIGIVLPAFLVFIIASDLYMVLPHTKVRMRHALTGALFTAVLFEAAKHVFTYYIVMKITEFGTLYGPLTAFVIFLLGAELVHNLHISRATSDGGQEDSICDLLENCSFIFPMTTSYWGLAMRRGSLGERPARI